LASIILDDVTIEFPIYDARTRSMKNRLLGLGTGGRIGVDRGSVHVRALRNVSLELRDGDRVGLVGRNGAGKSTLLRVLSGIYEPPQGRIVIEGTTATLLDISLGMDPDATGYDNIMLRSAILGVSAAEAAARIPEIEVEDNTKKLADSIERLSLKNEPAKDPYNKKAWEADSGGVGEETFTSSRKS